MVSKITSKHNVELHVDTMGYEVEASKIKYNTELSINSYGFDSVIDVITNPLIHVITLDRSMVVDSLNNLIIVQSL